MNPKPERFKHQQEVLDKNPDKYLFAWGTGCAKTRGSIELMEQKTFDVLVLVPKALVANWKREIELWSNGTTAYNVMTKENFKKHVRTIRRYDGVIVDECFPAGTKVLTPKGYVNIEEIKIDDKVISAYGEDTVYHIGNRVSQKLVTINNEITVTPEHKFLTLRGWVEAGNLKSNDLLLHYFVGNAILEHNEKLLTLWKEKYDWFTRSCQKVLFETLHNELGVGNKERKDGHFFTEISRRKTRKGEEVFFENEKKQSHEKYFSQRKNEEDVTPYWTQTFNTRRKWSWFNQTARAFVTKTREILASRIHHKDRAWVPATSLQARFSTRKEEGCSRNRRNFSLLKKSTESRQEKGQKTLGTRVESITFHKQGSTKVYNLGVKNHPSYVVKNILVHNCHFFSGMSSQISKALDWYLKAGDIKYVYCLTATPFLSKPWNVFRLSQMLGHQWSYRGFESTFFYSLRMGGRMIPMLKKGMEEVLADYVRKLGTPVTMDEAVDVPENNYVTEYFELNKKQEKKIIDAYDANPLVRFTREHQIIGGTLKGDDFVANEVFDCDKKDRVLDLADEHDKLMVVCRYNLEIDALAEEFTKKGIPAFIIRGDVKDRDAVIQAVRKLNKFVLLVNASCSEGWELPEVTTMVFYSYDFSLKNYIQMIGRIQRINNVAKRTYLSLIVKGTVDEEIFNCISRKQDFHIAIYQKKLGGALKAN